jgi:transposase
MPRGRHYPPDLTDAQWALIEPLLPAVRRGGRPKKHPRRAIVDAILYVVRTGCSWRQLPVDFPPWQTVYRYFARWEGQHVGPVRFVFADGGFAGQLVDWAARILRTSIEIVRKPKGQKGFAVIPRRWAVERTLAWLTAHRRLARDYERDPAYSEAMIRWAAIGGMARGLTRGRPATRQTRRTFDWSS